MPVLQRLAQAPRYAIEWSLFAAVVGLIGGLGGYTAYRSHADIERREGDRLQAQARVINDNLVQQIEGIDKSLTGVNDNVATARGILRAHDNLTQRLKSLVDAVPGVAAMQVLDSRGTVIAADSDDVVNDNFADRDYFRLPAAGRDPEMLYVSRPFRSRRGLWALTLTRILTDSEGRFAGVVTAGLDADYQIVVLRSVLYADDMRATLLHGGGLVYLNAPARPEMLGLDLSTPGSAFALHRESGASASLTSAQAPPAAGGGERLIASQTVTSPKVKLDSPLVIHVSRDRTAMFAGWRQETEVGAAICTIVACLSAFMLALAQRRRGELAALHRAAREEREASARRIQMVTDHTPALIAYIDRDERHRFVNAHYEVLYGTPRESFIGMSVRELMGDDVHGELRGHIAAVLRGERQSFERRGNPRGVEGHFMIDYVPDTDAAGEVRGFFMLAADITARKDAELRLASSEQMLREQERLLRTIADNLPVLISYFDPAERFRFINATATTWMSVDPAAAIGRGLREVIGRERYDARARAIATALAGQRSEVELEQADGNGIRYLHNVYIPVFEAGQAMAGVVCLSTDITTLRLAHRKVEELARADPLTGLANRRQFDERLAEAVARARRDARGLALMVLDIDHFKAINDGFGHGGGDAALCEFADRLQSCLRATDLAARLGGDEFAVVLEGVTARAEAEAVARKVLEAMRAPLAVEGRALRMTTSIGIALAERVPAIDREILRSADEALYKAKRAGRNRFRIEPCNAAAGIVTADFPASRAGS